VLRVAGRLTSAVQPNSHQHRLAVDHAHVDFEPERKRH